ncbi:response regulator [Noviherbaspirillum sp. ST9]|uniref:response regulator n=1 Tax=Noviherbaspirillum sp. ST9 TaxID=3401606 RepID=UPI003B587E7F
MENTGYPTILIVDDEERNVRLLDVLLRTDGYRTLSASSGAEALALATSAQPDLILLDLMMPGMDGFEVTQALKNASATAAIPVLIVSALDDVATRRRLLASGADEFIRKPVDRWELSLRMSRLLGTDRSPEEDSANHG